jgi:hypothetical protein
VFKKQNWEEKWKVEKNRRNETSTEVGRFSENLKESHSSEPKHVGLDQRQICRSVARGFASNS